MLKVFDKRERERENKLKNMTEIDKRERERERETKNSI